jgi:DedD protein
MRHAAVYDDEVLQDDSAELNLSMGTLIGIFFGLALVCGVFFGFGYMLGHRTPGPYVPSEPLYESPKPASAPVAAKPSALVSEPETSPAQIVVPVTPKPTVTTNAAANPAPSLAQTAPAPALNAARSASSSVTTEAPTSKPTYVPTSAPISTPSQPATPTISKTGTIMVQIAAVKGHADAEALATALRKNGFTPTVRSEPQDKLLHVQIGPFASRDDAKAMRQKLANAGYDAFIK